MRIGVTSGAEAPVPLDNYLQRARSVAAAGLDDMWMAHTFTFDAITALAVIGQQVPNIGFGTAVTPTPARHPMTMAQQALTAAAATDNRFTLGIGLSHKLVIEDMLGLSYARPAAQMRAYLEALMPMLRGEQVKVDNPYYKARNIHLVAPGTETPRVVVAALGPAMLDLAGELADGTTLWMVGERTIGEHIMPRIRKAAAAAGRGDPAIIAALPIAIAADEHAARDKIGEALTIYGQLPSYRAMLDREGVKGPADLAVVGNDDTLWDALDRLADLGVTHFNASIMPVEPGAWERTLESLSEWRRSRGRS